MHQNGDIFKNFFNQIKIMLKIAAVWGDDDTVSTVERYIQKIYNAFWQVYVLICYIPSESLYIAYSYNTDKFLAAIRDNGNHVACLYKVGNFLVKRKRVVQLMEVLSHIDHFEDYKDYKPREIIDKERKAGKLWVDSLIFLAMANCAGLLMSSLFVFVFFGDKQFAVVNGEEIYNQKLPVESVLAWSTATRPKYLFSLFYTVLPITQSAMMIINSTFYTCLNCVSAHFKVLQGAFQTIHERCMKRLNYDENENFLYDPEDLQAETGREIGKCINHLQVLYRACEEVEGIFNFQTLVQTSLSLGEICFSLYLLSETGSEQLAAEVTYVTGTCYELLGYSWFGDKITETTQNFGYYLYDSNWFPTNLKFRKQLIITLTRLTKPMYITIGKVTPLTLNTFLTIMRGSYSFLTFLKQRDNLQKM